MATSSRSEPAGRRAAAVLIGYNLPWLAWTTYAAVLAVAPGMGGWRCPVHAALGWCPSCGLTHAYADLLRGEGAGWWLSTILLLFMANAVVSLVRARGLVVTKAQPG
jgi:hypothetical protein